MKGIFARLAAAFAAISLVTAPGAAMAQTAERTLLSINATGESEAEPDFATITLGVTAHAQTAPAALAENSRRMEGLLQALRAADVATRDIQTAQVSVSPRYRYASNEEERLIDYEATNTVRVLVRRIGETGRIAAAAIEAGGNRIQNVSFSVNDRTAQYDLARRNAATEARRRAEVYAASFGLSVVRVAAITEPGAANVTVGEEIVVTGTRISREGYVTNAPVQPASISPGTITTRATLNVTFELR